MITRDEILATPAGPRLNDLVAKYVMKWQRTSSYKGRECGKWRRPDGKVVFNSPDYSIDIAKSWQVAEKLPNSVQVEIRWDGKKAEVWFDDGARTWAGYAVTVPLAICYAALLAVTEE